MTNEERADIALATLSTFADIVHDGHDGVMEEDIGDLICDLLHLAAANNYDPLKLVQNGISHYAVECIEEDGMYCEASVEVDVYLRPYGKQANWRPFNPNTVAKLRAEAEKAKED